MYDSYIAEKRMVTVQMKISMAILDDKLDGLRKKSYISDDCPCVLKGVKLISPGQTDLAADYVYLATAANFQKDAHKNGHASLITIGQFDPSDISGFPESWDLIMLDAKYDISTVLNEVVECFAYYTNWDRMLQDALNKDRGLQHLLDISYSVFQQPMYLVDSSFRSLAYTKSVSNDDVDDIEWTSIVQEGYSSLETIRLFKDNMYYSMINSATKPIIFAPRKARHRCISANIRIANQKIGCLVILEVFGSLKTCQLHLAEHLAGVISFAVHRDKIYQNTRGTMYEYFILELLEGKSLSKSIVDNQLKYLGWKSDDKYYVLLIRMNDKDIENSVIEYTGTMAEKTLKGCRSILHGNEIVVIINSSRFPTSNETITGQIVDFLVSNNIRGGLSMCFNNFSEISPFYIQASACLNIGLEIDPDKSLYLYGDYAVHHLIKCSAGSINLEKYCHPSVLELLNYDRLHKTDYSKSLKVYLSKNRNLVDSAKALFIHRNTLVSRIAKIQELLHLNMDDDDVRLYILLSYKVLDLI